MARRPSIDDKLLPLGIAPKTLFVTGKGGVGKTTVAAALANAYARAGARTLLVEIEGHEGATSLFSNRRPKYDPVVVGRSLWACRIDNRESLREYAQIHLKVKTVANALVSNPVVSQFAEFAPGFDDVMTLGKVWRLAAARGSGTDKAFDAIVVDAPATGHGIGLLTMVSTVARAFPVGMIADQGRAVDSWVRDHDAFGAIVVTLGEELPVTEAVQLHGQLDEIGVGIDATLANAIVPDRFSADEIAHIADLAGDGDDGAEVAGGVFDTAVYEHERVCAQLPELLRLADDAGPYSALPRLYADELGADEVQKLMKLLPKAPVVTADDVAERMRAVGFDNVDEVRA